MIIDSCGHFDDYKPLLRGIGEALSALRELGSDPGVGRYEFEGGYFMIQEGKTRSVDDGDFEAHRRYLDVQVILKGSEVVAWSDTAGLSESLPYDGEKDKVMFSGKPQHTDLIKEGMFWVAFPHDAHKACRDLGEGYSYKKAVIKLPVA